MWLTAPVQKIVRTRLALAGKCGVPSARRFGPNLGPQRRLPLGTEQSLLRKEGGECNPTQPRRGVAEKTAAIQQEGRYHLLTCHFIATRMLQRPSYSYHFSYTASN